MDLNHTPTWTGLTSKEDIQLRRNPNAKKYWVFEFVGPETTHSYHRQYQVTDNQERAKEYLERGWNSWLAMLAENEEQAVNRYEDAMDQYDAFYLNDPDWLNAGRSKYSRERTYECWVKEYKERYGVDTE